MLLLSLLLTALAVEPAPAPPVEPLHPGAEDADGPIDLTGWSVLAYNGYLVDSSFRVSTDLRRAVDRLPKEPDAAALATFRTQLHDAFALAVRRVERLPDWHGDAAFRDVALASVRWALDAVDTRIAELHVLVTKPVVVDADLARAEAIVRGINDTARDWDAQLKEAQRAFAGRVGFTLTEGAPKPAAKAAAVFTAPGFPPPGSALPAVVHVGFATRYHNALLASDRGLLDAFNACVEAMAVTGPEAAHRCEDALEVAKQVLIDVRAVPPWQGDASLRDALVELSATFVKLLSGPGKEAADVLGRTEPTPVDLQAFDLAAGLVNQESTAALRRFDDALKAFQQRWGMAAYDAWRKANP